MKLLIIAPYTLLPEELGFNRFYYIAENLSKLDCEVVLITSRFRHFDKQFRSQHEIIVNKNFKIVFLEEKGYQKNIGLSRIISHMEFDYNLKAFLNSANDKFDMIYSAIPTPNAACMAGEYAKSRNLPFIIDVQDIWPEAMKMAIDAPLISDLLFYPMKRKVNRAYAMADMILGVSETYVARAAEVNTKAKIRKAVFIGADIELFDQGADKNIDRIRKPENEFWISYIGTLGHSYDIDTMIDAANILRSRKIGTIRFKLLGDGPLRQIFEKHAYKTDAPVDFIGFVNYELMAAYLKKSDIAVNAIKKKSTGSIINKVGDYLTAGIPVINGGLNKEFRDLLNEYDAGIAYVPESAESLANKIEMLFKDEGLRLRMGQNARKLAEEKFDRNKTYQDIYDVVISAKSHSNRC